MRYHFDIPSLLEWVLETWAPVCRQADRAAYSRSHFSRIFRKDVGETPTALKRRLQLEAGAHLLARTRFSIGSIAVEVGYETPEAFAKSFRRAYGRSPRDFRRAPPSLTLLGSSSGIHFHPSGLIVRRQGDNSMNLNQILFRQHVDEITRILDHMANLSEEQLDKETIAHGDCIPWDSHGRSLRATMRSIVATHQIWLAALKGDAMPETLPQKPSVEELRRWHLESSSPLLELVAEVEEKNLWRSEFVDALCEPPTRFEFGAVLAHILVFGIHRRMLALAALRDLGVDSDDYGDPIQWLRAQGGEPSVCC